MFSIDRGNSDDNADDNLENDDDDEAVDMEDFEESGMLHQIDPVCKQFPLKIYHYYMYTHYVTGNRHHFTSRKSST